MNTNPLLVDGLSYCYGALKALDNVSFAIAPATCVGLLGANGSGKTTLFGLLTRLLSPATGDIKVFDQNLSHSPGSALQNLGVVFQQSSLDLDLSVVQNLNYHAALQGMDRKLARQRIIEELKRFKLENRANDRVRQLNQGHRRRVEIARALLHKPRLLLLDEATVGLDFETRQMLNTHIRSLCETEGISVLWATHLVEDIELDDNIIWLQDGQVMAQGVCRTLLENSQEPNLQELLQHLSREGL